LITLFPSPTLFRSFEGKYDKEFYLTHYPKEQYYLNAYWDKAKKFKTFQAFKKHIIDSDTISYNEWLKRAKIDFKCWQFGRSGGWFSICEESDLENDILVDQYGYSFYDEIVNAEDNNEFNIVVKDYSDDKKQLLKDLRGHLQDYNEKVEAIQSVINDIEDSKKFFKETLLQQLEYEIDDFVGENLKQSNVTIKIEEDKVKTSLGVSVVLGEFKDIFNLLSPQIENLKRKEKLTIGKRVGNYTVEYAKRKKDDVIIKAGCHRFSFNQIKQVM
jgi:F0F1-type ATP synthase membrane subunit b/b'